MLAPLSWAMAHSSHSCRSLSKHLQMSAAMTTKGRPHDTEHQSACLSSAITLEVDHPFESP